VEEKSLVDHLRDLRSAVLYSILYISIGMVVAWIYKEQIFDIIRRPISPYLKGSDGGLVYTNIMENFIAYVKVSLIGGVIISCPFWIYQIWKFISPALYKDEKKYALGFVFFGTVLFLTGVCFSYFLVYPFMFDFLFSFGNGKDQAMITIAEYLGFFIKTTILFGVAFEMPLIITILGVLGFVSSSFLKANRRYAVLLISIASAILTPPDPLSMIMMLIPLYALFEISIFGVKYLEPKEIIEE
jgi:sec-independent protein translocase protein TatC